MESTFVIDRPAALYHQPPRLGDLLHARLGDGDVHSAIVESVADDGETLTVRGPAEPHRRKELIVVIRRVGASPEE